MRSSSGLSEILYAIAALVFILGLVAMSSWKAWAIPLVLFGGLFFVQGMLSLDHPLYRFLHEPSGILIIVGFGYLFGNLMRHRLSARGVDDEQ